MPRAEPIWQAHRADLGEVRGHIARPAEIERMAEGNEAAIADQQVEGAGEHGEAERLHHEQWIEENWRDEQHADHQHESELLAPTGGGERGPRNRCGDGGHALARPNSPAGRTSRTSAMITKMTVFEASGKNTLVSPSTMPSPKPVTIAPMIDPMPPITTTANTTMMSSAPICGDTL